MLSDKTKMAVFYFMWLVIIFSPLLNASQTEQSTKQPDLTKLSAEIISLQHQFHYNPTEIASPEFKKIQQNIRALAKSANSLDEFVSGFNRLWQDGPFSHVRLAPAQTSALALATYLDQMNAGPDAVKLNKLNASTMLLAVTTMMGTDTIANINKAFVEIAKAAPNNLIIDLRQNHGGAFAVKPLVEHLTRQPLEVGTFVSQRWFKLHHLPPQSKDSFNIEPWSGWSIQRFWQDVQAQPLTRIQMSPQQPTYTGKVFVLVSKQTASAAELAADALSQLPNVTLVGETTAGQMLSQTIFDLPYKLHLYIPVADYYSATNGRIEGVGVVPDIKIKQQEALSYVLESL